MKLIYQLLWIFFWSAEVILPAQQNAENITFEYKILNKKECKRYFKTKKILKKGYQPIQIMVKNNSDDPIALSQEGFNVSTVSADTVIAALHKNGIARGFALGACAAPAAMPLYMFLSLPPAFWITSCVYFTTFFTAAMFTGFGAKMYNQKITVITDLTLQDQVVRPHTVATGIVFVKSDSFNGDLTLIVKNQNSQELLTLSSNL